MAAVSGIIVRGPGLTGVVAVTAVLDGGGWIVRTAGLTVVAGVAAVRAELVGGAGAIVRRGRVAEVEEFSIVLSAQKIWMWRG